ncbi:hypothetical protein HF520_13640 [Romboutsia sp. CE17]|uniref:hypothetical protein n=1 Tax=Romboutsia sp. CE17 TaxID=2724150 RepID=UPI001442A669|nr:hypothetical protein [Romboutsia sp. CE17]QJA09846.1 hypothetical protein HF520_13640 [Romboutsia sp. CE17]
MYNEIDDVKKELEQLCEEYIKVLENLKSKNMISSDTFEQCAGSKIMFLNK